MQTDSCTGLCIALLFLLVGLKLVLGGTGFFRGFSHGFWNGFFNWLFVGSRGPARVTMPIGCLVMILLLLLLMLIGLVGRSAFR